MTIKKIVAVNYKFTDKLISGGNIAKKVKKFIENNSRNLVKVELSVITVDINEPYSQKKTDKHVELAKKQFNSKLYDIRIHFCNPRISHAGRGDAITHASYTNAVHETLHLFGMGHANTHQYVNGNPTTIHSRDPFDILTMFSPYASLNPVHRFQLKWFLEPELTDVPEITNVQTFKLEKLTNFTDKTSPKTILIRDKRIFVSYGTFTPKRGKKKNVIVFHSTDTNYQFSYHEGFFEVENGKMIIHKELDISLEIINCNDQLVEFKFL